MQAIVYNRPWDVQLTEKAEPVLSLPDEVIVEIRATGICGTDLSIISGEYDARPQVIIGHESAGVVVATGSSVDNCRIGDRVIIDPTYYCGYCEHCRKGLRNHCLLKAGTEAGVSVDGTFTRYFKTTQRFIYPLADHIPFEQGAMSEPLSCVLTAVKKLAVTPYMRTAILGGGPIGLLFYQALSRHGIRDGVICETSPQRIKLIEGNNFLANGWQTAPAFVPKKNQYDLIIDTTGSLLEKSMLAIADGGKISLMGLRNNQQTINPREIADRSISIIGSIDSADTFKHAVDLINSGTLGLEKLITHAYPLQDFQAALQDLGCDPVKQQRTNQIASLKSVIMI
ncbi:zinc-dependent alcohol dehydrogenase [Chitinophaga nivalis]|uniref:Alcohol dehydrogenase catalytic domain-containing protein n=1 Tax=Chitinophaga nivalis TaxID=2991709 RepID=A0ABT3IQC9_9BACT|nr:alcohol dehydrogenase catalytic domain-containing protein [Chitinophaga nivalis]MCW3464142.1 alcohol dehydrogenase catalytic domain-containing protein [Chitinophaga nivalis]MCW3486168.1 alcohol dehydrogenase catalytic domain-containing protein [Chitinophaga nivalis]